MNDKKYVITGFRDVVLDPNDFGCNVEMDNPTVFPNAEYAFAILAQMKKWIIENKKTTWADTPEQEADNIVVQQMTAL